MAGPIESLAGDDSLHASDGSFIYTREDRVEANKASLCSHSQTLIETEWPV